MTLDEIRSRARACRTERTAVADASLSEAEFQTKTIAWCEQQAAEGNRQIALHLTQLAAYGSMPAETLRSHSSPGATVPALVALLGAPVVASRMLAQSGGVEFGLPPAERAKLLAKLDATLLALEIEEERLIEASEAAGAPIARRGDADPRAVLCVIDDDYVPVTFDEPPAPIPTATQEPAPPRERVSRSSYLGKRQS